MTMHDLETREVQESNSPLRHHSLNQKNSKAAREGARRYDNFLMPKKVARALEKRMR